jgi:FMN phosphatase YigB (HAD superfamily)
MPPEFIYFDMGNVLVKFSHELAVRQMSQVAGVSAERVYETVFGGDLNRRFELGQVSRRQFYEEFCEATGSRPDPAELARAGTEIFEPSAAILPLVAHLEGAGYRLGILSNTCQMHWEYVRGRFAIVAEPFELATLSFECGAMKPDATIYRAAAERAGVAAERIFFTDDRPENVEGAREQGWDAVLFTGAHDLAIALAARGARTNY